MKILIVGYYTEDTVSRIRDVFPKRLGDPGGTAGKRKETISGMQNSADPGNISR